MTHVLIVMSWLAGLSMAPDMHWNYDARHQPADRGRQARIDEVQFADMSTLPSSDRMPIRARTASHTPAASSMSLADVSAAAIAGLI